MCYVLMEVFQKVGCPSICFCEGHLYMLEVIYGARNSQIHRAEFSNQVFDFFRDMRCCTGGGCLVTC